MPKEKLYKIRNKESGKFSTGVFPYLWHEKGKVWTDIKDLKSHFNTFIEGGKIIKENPYKNCEIIEIEVDYDNCQKRSIEELIQKVQEEKREFLQKYLEIHKRQKGKK